MIVIGKSFWKCLEHQVCSHQEFEEGKKHPIGYTWYLDALSGVFKIVLIRTISYTNYFVYELFRLPNLNTDTTHL
jgi:hypothetical protein